MDVVEDLSATTAAEEKILAGVPVVSTRGAARDEDLLSADWSGDVVRAELLQRLVRAGKAVHVEGAEVIGSLDLSGTTLAAGVRLRHCLFREPVDVSRATVPALDLGGSHVSSLLAGGLSCDSLEFGDRGVVGRIVLTAATLGNVSLPGLLLGAGDADTWVLDANVLTTSRSADLGAGFEARGGVRLIGASIGGQLSFRQAVVHGDLFLHEVSTARALYLREGLFHGAVHLTEAWVRGKVDGRDARFTRGAQVLNLDGTTVERTVHLSGAVVDGDIHISRATIKGSVVLSRATFSGSAPGSCSPQDDSAEVPLSLDHPSLEPQDLEGVVVRIEDCQIGGNVELDSATVHGSVVIRGTTVGGSVDLRWTHLQNHGRTALDLSGSTVSAALQLRQMGSVDGGLDLSRVSLGRLDDDFQVWDAAVEYDLRGLTYDAVSLDGPDWPLTRRLTWLSDQTPFSGQPYEHLAGLLMRNGRRQEAWRVLECEHDARHSQPGTKWPRRALNKMWSLLLGHGYRPERAAVALAVLFLAGWLLYAAASGAEAMRPDDPDVVVENGCTPSGDCFSAWRYSLENTLPFLGLETQKAWRVDDRVGAYRELAYGQVILGWFLATACVAGLTRRWVKT